jgi:Ca2+-binding RTX toxin-like protein
MSSNMVTMSFVSTGTTSGSVINSQLIAQHGSDATLVVTGPVAATLVGGNDNDQLIGGAGDNWISGGLGADTLTGGGGVNHFIYAAAAESPVVGSDVITNFNPVVDRLVFEGVLHGTFAFLGAAGFTGLGNSEARFDDATKLLSVDLDGNGTADMGIILAGAVLANLAPSDFLWT